MNVSDKLDELAKKTDEKILKNLEDIDQIKSQAEEEIEKLIITSEMNLKDKIEERLDVASHLKNFPIYFFDLYHKTKENSHLLPAFKEAIRLIFSCYQALDKNAVKSILPIVQMFDEKQKITLKDVIQTQKIISEALNIWLISEFVSYFNTSHLAQILENILSDIQNIETNKNVEKTILLKKSLSFVFVKNIRSSSLLPYEAKIKLLDKIATINDNLMHRINQLLIGEIQYTQKHKVVIIEYLLEFLKKIGEASIVTKQSSSNPQ